MGHFKDKYEFQCDKYLMKSLLSMKTTFKEHYNLSQQIIATQQKILENLWMLCQRGVPCVRPYPRDESTREERYIREEFHIQKQYLYRSNSKSTASLLNLKAECSTFDQVLAKIDARIPSPIMESGKGRQPINYYIELFTDLFKFFNEFQKKSNMLGKFLTVSDIVSILEYKVHLEPNRDLNKYFETCLDA